MSPTSQSILGGSALAAICGSLYIWSQVIIRIRRRDELVPFEPRRPVPWTWVDLLLMVVAYLAVGVVAQWAITEWLGLQLPIDYKALNIDSLSGLQAILSGTTLLVLLFAIGLVVFRTGANAADLGLRFHQAGSDVGLGFIAFVAIAPPVYAIQALLHLFFPEQHSLIVALRAMPGDQLFLVIGISVMLVAPLSEELLFRVLLQGCLESALLPEDPTGVEIDADDAQDANDPNSLATPSAGRWLPILISSLIFSAMHLGQGPAPIPLFFLALMLGYLYQRTHRILPSLVVHFLLNASTLAMLWLNLRG